MIELIKTCIIVKVLIISFVLQLINTQNIDAQGFSNLHVITSGEINGLIEMHSFDADNDGDLDVFANTYYKFQYLENLGDSEYKHHILPIYFDEPYSFTILDVDNDGYKDIVYTYFWHSLRMRWLKNLGDFEFVKMPIIENDMIYMSSLESHDINGDGFEDLIVRSSQDSVRLAIFYNNRIGGFSPPDTVCQQGVSAYQCIDIDYDDDLDIIYLISSTQEVHCLFNIGNASFVDSLLYQNSFNELSKVWAFDSDSDGDYDLLLGDMLKFPIMVINDGNFDYSTVIVFDTIVDIEIAEFTDYDQDQDIDIIFSRNNFASSLISVLINNGNNNFVFDIIKQFNYPAVSCLELSDVDNNNWDDIVFGSYWGTVGWLENSVDQHFENHYNMTSDLTSVHFVDAKDFNNDGYPDIVVQDYRSFFVVYINDGFGNFLDTIQINQSHRYSENTFAFDFNNDSYCDLLSFSDYDGSSYEDSTHFIFDANNQDLSFTKKREDSFNNMNDRTVTFLDSYGDSKKEIILTGEDVVDSVYILDISEDFTITKHSSFYIDPIINFEQLDFIDFDNNGLKDMIVVDNYTVEGERMTAIIIHYFFDWADNPFRDTLVIIPDYYRYNKYLPAKLNIDTLPDFIVPSGHYLYMFTNIGNKEYEYSYFELDNYRFDNLYAHDMDGDSIDEFLFSANDTLIGYIKDYTQNSFEVEYFPHPRYGVSSSNKKQYCIASDIDVDGDQDFVSINYLDNGVYWLENDLILYQDEADSENLQAKLYPNPSNNQFTVELPDNKSFENSKLQIFDIRGSEISTEYVLSSSSQINIITNNLKPGIYFLTITSDSQTFNSKFIVSQP